MIEPLGVGHRGARGQHADPGAVCRLGEEDGNFETARQDGETGDVVLVLVGDEDGVERAGSSPAMDMRFSSSRQERPASTRTRVRELEMTVLLPLEPEASTVMRIIG